MPPTEGQTNNATPEKITIILLDKFARYPLHSVTLQPVTQEPSRARQQNQTAQSAGKRRPPRPLGPRTIDGRRRSDRAREITTDEGLHGPHDSAPSRRKRL